jgi:sugar-specific transcriptional regulator TrmB
MLESLGLTEYESKAYLAVLSLGTADARSICNTSGVPSSKIYNIMDKFELLGLVEVQRSKPAKFRAVEPEVGIEKLFGNREKEIRSLKENLPVILSELNSVYSERSEQRKTFFNLEFGMKNHIQKHVAKLAEAEKETLSYFENTCLYGARIYGADVKPKIVQNVMLNDISSRILFGVSNIGLAKAFLRGIPASDNIETRITKQIHAPFHVIDSKSAIMVIDNPLIKDGRIASVYVINRELVHELREGYESLWDDAKDASRFLT